MTRRYRSSRFNPRETSKPVSMTPTVNIGIPFSIVVHGVALEGNMSPSGELSVSGLPNRVTVFPKTMRPLAICCDEGRWYIFGGVDYPELLEKLVNILTDWYKLKADIRQR